MTNPDDRTTREDDRPTKPPAEEPPAEEPPAPAEEQAESPSEGDPPETARRPAPGIEHEPEPSGENLIPRKEGPGTL